MKIPATPCMSARITEFSHKEQLQHDAPLEARLEITLLFPGAFTGDGEFLPLGYTHGQKLGNHQVTFGIGGEIRAFDANEVHRLFAMLEHYGEKPVTFKLELLS